MSEHIVDEYNQIEDCIKLAQDELLAASIEYDAIIKNEDFYTNDYIELAAAKVTKAELRIDAILVDYYLLYPNKLGEFLKRKTANASLVNVVSLDEFAQEHYEDPDCYQKLMFSDYLDYVMDSI
jgi:hypothetical protein